MNQSLFKYFGYLYDTPTFKTNAFRLLSNEGWLKRLLLLYKQIIQSYLGLTGNVFHHIPLV